MRRSLTAFVVAVLLIAGLALGAREVWRHATGANAQSGCTFGAYTTDTGQASVAATMAGVTLQRELPERALVLAITAAWQESKLRNIPSGMGDLDSVGILQQRPSQGWGTEAELSDVATATGKFLDALVKVPDWQTADAATVIQEVQVSADGSAYTRHEAKSQAMADALTGATAEGVTCSFPAPDKVASGSEVAVLAAKELPISAPTVQGSTVTVPGAGWATASWFVANADRLGIDSVAYSGRRWTRAHGWQDDSAAPSNAVTSVLAR